MLISFPHMGSMSIPLKSLFISLGCDVILPPPISKRTLELGVRHSPETVCLPFKLTLGNMIEAIEQGADTIVTCGGVGPCRLGYYAQVQKEILRGLGYEFEMMVIEPNLSNVLRNLRRVSAGCGLQTKYSAFRLTVEKINALDSIERKVLKIRPREKATGEVDGIWNKALAMIDAADTVAHVRSVWQEAEHELDTVAIDPAINPLRIGVVGEIYVMIESFVNQDLDRRLGGMGVEVRKTMLLSDYVSGHLFRKRTYLEEFRRLANLARPYLGHYVGGHGLKSIAHTIDMGQANYDGIIHVFPFSCMPEVVAVNILPKVSRDADIPVLSIAFDEQSGNAGITTRLEAFVDLLSYRRLRKNNNYSSSLKNTL